MARQLGPRLARIALYVPHHAKLGDIGTDHAYLPIALCEQGILNSAVAVDVHQGPYESAKVAVANRNLEDKVSVRLGNGLLPLRPGEVDTLTIAGMGGNTILGILSERADVLEQVRTLILQPQGAEGKVRLALLASGWHLEDEALVEEDGQVYVVMVYARVGGLSMADVDVHEEKWLTRMKAKLSEELDSVDLHLFMERARALFWNLGPLVLAKGGGLVVHLLEERSKVLHDRITEMQKGEPIKVNAKIREARMEITAVEALRKTIDALISGVAM